MELTGGDLMGDIRAAGPIVLKLLRLAMDMGISKALQVLLAQASGFSR